MLPFIKKVFIANLAVLLFISIAYSKELTVESKYAKMMSGPGSYYKLIKILKYHDKITQLQEKSNWIKGSSKGEGSTEDIGWISKTTFIKKERQYDLSNLDKELELLPVSTIETTASIRGLSELLPEEEKYNFQVVEDIILRPYFNIDEMENFIQQTCLIAKAEENIFLDSKEKKSLEETDILREDQMGYIFAAKILANNKIYDNPQVIKYINIVGNYVAMRSVRSDITYRFIVLDRDDINSFSAPGGFIFITKGILKIIKDEAELAGVLGHEIVHIAHSHGSKAQKALAKKLGGGKREFDIMALEGELEREVESAHKRSDYAGGDLSYARKKIFSELNDELFRFLDATIGEGRAKEDEFEADLYGSIYLYRMGYDPTGLLSFLKRLQNKDNDEDERSFLSDNFPDLKNHPSVNDRINKLEKSIKAFKKDKGPRFQERFQVEIKEVEK